MQIPIENIYFILCYAWDKLEERDIIRIESTDTTKLVNLFAMVLISGTNHLMKRGFDRGYVNHKEDTSRLRGKINFNSILKTGSLIKGKVNCEFSELSYNVLHNRILKTTIKNLIQVEGLDSELRESLIQYFHNFHEIDDLKLSKKVFRQVQLHRNNYFYDFLLKTCELIYDNLLPSQKKGKMQFRDFFQDEKKMPIVFENFVRNFYKLEAKEFKVGRQDIKWAYSTDDIESEKLLPKMQTDITLTSENQKIIIDCKFKKLFQENYGTQKFHSDDLYQINAYLNNLPDNPLNNTCRTILLYPTADNSIKKNYQDPKGRIISICTINLNQNWQNIRQDLLTLINEFNTKKFVAK